MMTTNNTDGAALLPVTREALIDEIISMYHTTRLSCTPAATHILSKSSVQDAFARFERDILARHRIATQEDAERSGVDELRRLLDNVGGFLDDFARADLDEGAADAVTVGMVYQQQAQTVVLPRIRRALAALSTPQRQEYDGEAVREAEAWLREISDWLLANDHDMTLPSGILDTDPLDIADSLAALAHPAQARDEMRAPAVDETDGDAK